VRRVRENTKCYTLICFDAAHLDLARARRKFWMRTRARRPQRALAKNFTKMLSAVGCAYLDLTRAQRNF
jgi:hypothetical protein